MIDLTNFNESELRALVESTEAQIQKLQNKELTVLLTEKKVLERVIAQAQKEVHTLVEQREKATLPISKKIADTLLKHAKERLAEYEAEFDSVCYWMDPPDHAQATCPMHPLPQVLKQ